jgi:hypothetical protein
MAEPLSSLPASPPAKPIPWPDQRQDTGLSPVPPRETKPPRLLNDAAERARDEIERYWAAAQSTVTRLFSRTRKKMLYLPRERPLHIVAAIALTGFFLGAALRIWRSHHD